MSKHYELPSAERQPRAWPPPKITRPHRKTARTGQLLRFPARLRSGQGGAKPKDCTAGEEADTIGDINAESWRVKGLDDR